MTTEPTERNPLDTLPLRRIDIRPYLPAALAGRWRFDADAATRHAVLTSLNRLLSTLSTYLPRHLLYDLIKSPLPGHTQGTFLSSTVLFADVSGFTAMSERLSALGREGAETLTSVINNYFTCMSDIAARHGGDLMIFGGDAMLFLFDGIEHALRACHSAWQMQQAMAERFAEVRTAQGNFQLRMAAGLGSGQVFAASLGSATSMHYAVMGQALALMGRAEALAGGGRIILDEATCVLAGSLQVQAEGESGFARLTAEPSAAFTRPGPPLLEPPPAAEAAQIDWLARRIEAVVPFLPTGLLPRLVPDPAATLEGEHRPVTVLFIDFRDADTLIDILGADNPNDITPRLNAAFDAARSVVARYEGVINKISAGPAGPHIIALFGAPTSHEDDPERAVRAAIEIRAALASTDLPGVHRARIGINTGFVYAANVGSHARREYTVMGDQVNLAARLMSAAQPDEIVVSASTAAHIERTFDLDERAPVQVKGKAQPQRNFVVRGVRGRPVTLAPAASGRLIGRGREIAIGVQRIQLARQSTGQIIAVSGEAGAGKSRVVEALAEHARAEGFNLISSACVSYGGDIPYLVWLEPLRALIDLPASDTEPDRRAKLQAALAAIGRSGDVPIVGEIMGVPLADSSWTASLDAQTRQRRLFEIVAALMRHHAARQPLLWVIDDAHWIDPASRDLLDYTARHIHDAAIGLLVAYRPGGRWSASDVPHATEIIVPPLERSAIETLIADLLDLKDGQLPLALQTLMERMAAGALSDAAPDAGSFERYWGNPFFAQERIRALIDAGVLARDEHRQWQVTRPIESIEMPDTIHGVIMSRIDRLPEPARRILQVASVIGRAFDLNVLQAVYDNPAETSDSIQQHLSDLGDLGVSSPEVGVQPSAIGGQRSAVGSRRYVFRNVTTQEVAYASLRYERRRELHRRIGDFIEKQATLTDDQSGLLTHHYFEGQIWDKALPYALEAGWRAQQKYANAAAAGAYRRALQAADALQPPRTLEQLAAHEALGDVLVVTGEYEEALQHLEQARKLAAHDWRHLSDLCRKTAEARERRSEYEEAFAWLNTGLGYATPHSLEAARIYLMGAGVFYRQGKLAQATEWCEKSLSISRTLNEADARQAEARGLYLLAEILRKRGDLQQAIEAAQRAVTVYLVTGDTYGQSQVLNTLGSAYSEQGDFAAGTKFYTDSLQLKERIGDVAGQAMITLNLGENYRIIGELKSARQMQAHSLRIWRDLGNAYAVALLHNNLAATAIAEGSWDEAAERLAESEKMFTEIGSDDVKAELQRHRAELGLGRGQVAEALDWAQRSVSEAEASQEKLEMGLTRRVLAQAHTAQGDLAEAERNLQTSLDVLESIGSAVEAAHTRVVLAGLRRRQGRQEEAHDLLAAAIKTYESVGAESLIAQVRREAL